MTANSRHIVLFVLLLSSAMAVGAGPYARQLRDVDGTLRDLFAPAGRANVLFFVSSDCPVSNGYAPEIQRICGDYEERGVACALVYEDASIAADRVGAHRDEYRYKGIPAVIDGDRSVARHANATVTPQAIVVGRRGDREVSRPH